MNNKKFSNWAMLVLLALIWGSSFILMKRGLDVFTSNQVAALRLFTAFLFVVPIAYKHLKKEHFKHWKGFLGMGLFGSLIPAFLFTKAETGISSSLTGMLNSLTPLFTLILGVLFFKSKVKTINTLGVILGLIGAVGLLYIGQKSNENNNLNYGFFVLLATVFYGFSVNIIKKELGTVNSITASVWSLFFIGPVSGIYLFSTDFIQRINSSLAWESIGYISILGIFGTAVSIMIYNVLVKQTNALFASSVTYLIPIVAIAWGVLDNESIELLHIVCIMIILTGIYLVNKK